MAEYPRRGRRRCLVRFLCFAGGGLVGGFVLAVLAPGAELPTPTGSRPDGAVGGAVADGSTDAGVFWAQPVAAEPAAARRGSRFGRARGGHLGGHSPSVDDASAAPSIDAQRARSTMSTPIGSVGSGAARRRRAVDLAVGRPGGRAGGRAVALATAAWRALSFAAPSSPSVSNVPASADRDPGAPAGVHSSQPNVRTPRRKHAPAIAPDPVHRVGRGSGRGAVGSPERLRR